VKKRKPNVVDWPKSIATQADIRAATADPNAFHHWHEVVVPELMDEARHIKSVIDSIRALKSPHLRTLNLDTLLAMWTRQFESLLLYAEGSEGAVAERAFAALRERRAALIGIRDRLREARGGEA
jgi:hypothetical protein